MTAEDLLRENGISLPDTRPGRHYARCPQCSHKRSGGNKRVQCLGITIEANGSVRFGCNHCGWTGPAKGRIRSNGHTRDDPYLAIYDYTDEKGELLFQVCRKPDKTFPQRKPDGKDGWTWKTSDTRKVLYRLPELIEAVGNEQVIIVVEGEKDVESLRKIGATATCNPGGAAAPGQKPKWRAEYSEVLRGADIVIIPDHDEPGRAHGEAIAQMSAGIASRIRVLDLAKHWPECPKGGDVSDWLAAGHTREQLDVLIEQAPVVAGEKRTPVQSVFDPWAEYVVPAFPLHVLPPVAEDFVNTQSAVLGADPSAVAMAVLATFSAALDHRFALKMMHHGQWWEHPRLWVLLVGDSSRKKTPIINCVTRPLEQYQNHLRADYESKLKEHLAAGGNNEDGPPPPPRFVVWDTTTEKLGDILSRSERGLLVKRDEFAGWIGSMEKYGGASRGAGADRGFWLQAFDGGPYTVDRIKRGETYIKNLSVSLLGGIQPTRLAELHGLTSDGLLQRFLPVMMENPKLALDRPSDDEPYGRLMRELIFAKPHRLIMSDDALAVMNELRAHLHEFEQASGGLADGFQAFTGKLAGLAGSLALILHMAGDPSLGVFDEVERATIEKVQRLVIDFILPHAFEFYRTAESVTNGDRLKKLASWILTSGKTRIVASDLTNNIADFRGLSLLEINERVGPLVAAGWLEPSMTGPNCRAWAVSPAVAMQFAERARVEEARKSQMAKLMGSPRRPST